MSDRNLEPVPPAADPAPASPTADTPNRVPDLTLRTPPNWTGVLFLAAIAALHLSIALPAFYHRRWEGFLSLGLGIAFVTAAVFCWLCSCQTTFARAERRIRLRSGCRWVGTERSIPFRHVRGVRLTILSDRNPLASRIEVLCVNEDLECPPTRIPRQQALFLAMAMNVRLIKVYGMGVNTDAAERLDSLSA